MRSRSHEPGSVSHEVRDIEAQQNCCPSADEPHSENQDASIKLAASALPWNASACAPIFPSAPSATRQARRQCMVVTLYTKGCVGCHNHTNRTEAYGVGVHWWGEPERRPTTIQGKSLRGGPAVVPTPLAAPVIAAMCVLTRRVEPYRHGNADR
jgi:hypothetical protein